VARIWPVIAHGGRRKTLMTSPPASVASAAARSTTRASSTTGSAGNGRLQLDRSHAVRLHRLRAGGEGGSDRGADARELSIRSPAPEGALDFVAAFHQGFIVGWFEISPRSKYSRNPWPPMPKWAPKREAWDLGQRAGAEASRGYQRICGPLVNAPRKEVLQGRGGRGDRGAGRDRVVDSAPSTPAIAAGDRDGRRTP
jgi:hypothetical protein